MNIKDVKKVKIHLKDRDGNIFDTPYIVFPTGHLCMDGYKRDNKFISIFSFAEDYHKPGSTFENNAKIQPFMVIEFDNPQSMKSIANNLLKQAKVLEDNNE